MPELIITVEFSDSSDFDFARHRMVGAVEDIAEEMKTEGRFDGEVEVGWDVEQ